MRPPPPRPEPHGEPGPKAGAESVEDLAALAARVRRAPGAFAAADALAKVAQVAGCTRRELSRRFLRHFHATPEALLERARVEVVRRGLVAGGRLADLAAEAGWEGSEALEAAFRRAAGLSPQAFGSLLGERGFTLELPAGFLAGPTLRYLGRDAESLCERVRGTAFAKAARLAGRAAVLEVELGPGAARCRVRARGRLGPQAMAAAHEMALRLLGLAAPAAEPSAFVRRLRGLPGPGLGRLVRGREALRIPLTADPFEGLTWAVVGQQVNLAFAATLRRRVVELAGEPAGAGLRAHPDPAAVANLDEADLLARQFSRGKARYLIGVARAVVAGELPLASFPWEPATQVEARLLAVRGLGPWSAQYVLLRACGFADCAPAGDSGLATALERFFSLPRRPGPSEVRTLMEPFAPYRSLATCHLWATLG